MAAPSTFDPVLLVLGLFTRVATLPMIVDAGDPDLRLSQSWADHLAWLTFLLLLLTAVRA